MADIDRNSVSEMMQDDGQLTYDSRCSNVDTFAHLLPCNPTSVTASYYPKRRIVKQV